MKNTNTTNTTNDRGLPNKYDYGQYLDMALNQPGELGKFYTYFREYSIGNQFYIWSQCLTRELKLGPIATYKKWKELKRNVTKGSKALGMLWPVTFQKKDKDGKPLFDKEGNPLMMTTFKVRFHHFLLCQTEGQESTEIKNPNFDTDLLLKNLGIKKVSFDMTNGNCQGFARPNKKEIAINPIAYNPRKTLIHEVAHCILHGEDDTEFSHGSELPTDIKEVEAESVAYIVSAILGDDNENLKYSRGYIQHWKQGNELSEDTMKRIFKAVDTILKAGNPNNQDKKDK